MDTPITKTKEGKMKSATVKPFQAAWRIMGSTALQEPGRLATIMRAMVSPLRTSKEITRFMLQR